MSANLETVVQAIKENNIHGIGDNRKTVVAAGGRVLLPVPTNAKYVIVTAETDNTGVIVVGSETVIAALATRRGTPLNAGGSCGLPFAKVYIDSTVDGDGVTFTYLTGEK